MIPRLFRSLALPLLLAWLLAPALPGDEPARLAELQAQAEQGDAHAAQQLYMRYAVAGQTEEARAWASRYNELLAARAESGDVQAMLRLGSRYLTGEDYTEQSIEKAVTWFSRASETGNPAAAYILGDVFARQGNVAVSKQAYERAYGIYSRRAADEQDAEALYWCGFMELNGIGAPRDAASGIAKLELAAEKGSPWALSCLFKTYVSGIGTPRDEGKALHYARRLADEKGDGAMAYVVASAFIFGRGVAQDPALGERYLDQAVRANIPDAIYMKASRLEAEGKQAQALPLLRQAASMQQVDALVRYGVLLLHGDAPGVEQDTPRGLALLELAGNRLGSPRAAWHLARYYDDVGESQLADSWYVTASNGGVAEAMARRGLLHLRFSPYVAWSPTETYRWWRRGKQAGDPTCALYINLFLYVFTPLLLILVFGLPAFLAHRALKRRAAGDEKK